MRKGRKNLGKEGDFRKGNAEMEEKKDGGRGRDRTYDLTIKSRLLYQLSYVPERKDLQWSVRENVNTGFMPMMSNG
jgi:hypothetical protein